MVNDAGTDTPRRKYNSARRQQDAQQTRLEIVAAAREQFLWHGWHGASMRDIARSAGVAVETVYSNFSSKAVLLKEVLNIGVVGDAEPIPLADRAEFQALGVGTLRERTDALGRLMQNIHTRVARLRLVLREAARSDDELAELERVACAEENESVSMGLNSVAGLEVTDRAVDGFQAFLSSDMFVLLTEVRGWSPEQYAEWISDTTETLLKAKDVTA